MRKPTCMDTIPAPLQTEETCHRLIDVEIDPALPAGGTLEQERRVAIFDLLERNSFVLREGPEGPYSLRMGLSGRRITFDVAGAARDETRRFALSLGPIEQASRDYATLCEGYVEAIRTLPPAGIETIERARREIHAESARLLRARLSDRADIDQETAKRLFTLICVLTAEAGTRLSP